MNNYNNYIFNTRDSVQTAGRIEYSLDPRYIVKNTPFNAQNGFYSKLLPQFPQLENERTMELSVNANKKRDISFLEVCLSPVNTVSGIFDDIYSNRFTTDSFVIDDRIIGFGMFFIYTNIIFGI